MTRPKPKLYLLIDPDLTALRQELHQALWETFEVRWRDPLGPLEFPDLRPFDVGLLVEPPDGSALFQANSLIGMGKPLYVLRDGPRKEGPTPSHQVLAKTTSIHLGDLAADMLNRFEARRATQA